jgi:hypothetical protein
MNLKINFVSILQVNFSDIKTKQVTDEVRNLHNEDL